MNSMEIEVAGRVREIDLNHPVIRLEANPIVTASMVNRVWSHPAHQVITVHNAGVAELAGEVIMLFRSHLRNGISVLGIARSRDGIGNWHIDEAPALFPATKEDHFVPGVDPMQVIEDEAGGVEDPRITQLGDQYLITYSAYHGLIKNRVRVSLASTFDFKTFTRHGHLMSVDMRNVAIFPESIKGKFVGLFRPNDSLPGDLGGAFKQILIGHSNDWAEGWEVDPQPIIKQEGGPSAMADKIGPGAPPIKTKYGWINIFHGVRNTMDGNPYVLGVALHSLVEPRNIRVSSIPILFPTASDCNVEPNSYVHVPNVVFTCGALRRNDGVIYIYYGGNDTVMNVGFSHENILAELCRQFPREPLTGKPGYHFTEHSGKKKEAHRHDYQDPTN